MEELVWKVDLEKGIHWPLNLYIFIQIHPILSVIIAILVMVLIYRTFGRIIHRKRCCVCGKKSFFLVNYYLDGGPDTGLIGDFHDNCLKKFNKLYPAP